LILEVSPGSSPLVRAAAEALLILHISGAGIGLVSGAVALAVRKGGRLHRLAGNVFFVSMLTMTAIGACVAPFLPQPQRGSAIGGVITFYLVATSWATIRRKQGTVGRFEFGALLVALSAAVADVMLGVQAANSPTGMLEGAPAPAYFVFGSIAGLAAAGDLRMILRGGLYGAQRIARHLWRMCVALLIATLSFFLGQQQVFPAYLQGSPWLFVPEIVVLGLLIFWLCRVLFSNAYKAATAVAAPP
jgi:uncharacterized membrane protein